MFKLSKLSSKTISSACQRVLFSTNSTNKIFVGRLSLPNVLLIKQQRNSNIHHFDKFTNFRMFSTEEFNIENIKKSHEKCIKIM